MSSAPPRSHAGTASAPSARYPRSLRRALYERGLEQNIVAAGGAYRRPAIRPAPYYEPWGVQFVWDLPYSALAVARVGERVDLARGFVENMLDFAVTSGPDRGMLPRSVTRDGDQAGQDGSQTPLLAWLASELDRLEPDTAFLERAYPGLAAFVDWWQSPRRDIDGDGLSEYAAATPIHVAYESGHDFSPERDLVMGEEAAPGADGLIHEPFADVFLNSCLHAELEALERIAARVDPSRVKEWRDRRERLAGLMRETMWDAEVGAFFPVVRGDLSAGRQRVTRHTPAMLLPLWAGVATQEQADETVVTLRGRRRGYPQYDGVLSVRLSPRYLNGYRVVSDGLHPTRGIGGACGGVALSEAGLTLQFGPDRAPTTAVFTRVEVGVTVEPGAAHDARVVVEVEDGEGREVTVIDAVPGPDGSLDGVLAADPRASGGGWPWTRGLRRVAVSLRGCRARSVDLRYGRMDTGGLLSPYGIKSAHPLDGKHPAPGVPTEFWSGTVWGPHSYHGCHGLRRYGHVDLAAACARAFCDATAVSFAAGGDAFEHHCSETGRGLGIAPYTWGAAVALLLMEDLVDADGTEPARR